MKLIQIKKAEGRITLKTGLHIGSGDADMAIGGTDQPVVRHPFTREPYIPGSSLKGKIRSLLEMKFGLMEKTGGKPVNIKHYKEFKDTPDNANYINILKLFGTGATAEGEYQKLLIDIGPSRLSFSDCQLNEDYKTRAREENIPYFEVKSENAINRIKGAAEAPRFIERVIQGTEFDFSISLKEFDQDKEKGLEKIIQEGLQLLELDALGGSGSRGYGRIEFSDKTFKSIKE